MRRTSLGLLLILPLLTIAAQAAEGDGPITYTVRKGDTLVALGNKYLRRPEMYKIVQRQNGVTDPRRLQIGKRLAVPRNLLRFYPANARLVSVRGQVTAPDTGQLSNGMILGEGAQLATAASSFATLQLDDGSRISLPSNSNLVIRRLRSYVLENAIDYDFDVGKGGLRSSVSKLKSPDDRYRVRTPKAVSAVRGTDFQSRFDSDSGSDFIEVAEGEVAVVSSDKPAETLPAGNGITVAANGNLVREAMLSEPELVSPVRIQANKLVRFLTAKSGDAGAYRVSIAADAGFVEQLDDVVTADGRAEFADIPDGNYFVRVRARSKSGIEGKPATVAFKRRLNSVTASTGQDASGYVFRWQGDGEGKRRYHFQLFRGATDIVPIIDEAGLDADRVIISDLPSGEYFWRVGAVQYLDGEAATNWTELEKLAVSP